MKDGAGPPGAKTETLEHQPEIPSEAVPDTMRRDQQPAGAESVAASGTPPAAVPLTRPVDHLAADRARGGAPDDDPDFPEVDRHNYVVGAEFARGGLGRILEARDRRLDRTVAIKELLSTDARAQARFIREAKITARLEHPNIVPIHEAGHWPGGPRFYAMKLVRGETLASRFEDAVTEEDRQALLPHLINVAEAVAYAHSQGILHRDLKPSNVMVGLFGETVVIDWGLAKDLNDDESYLPSSDDHMSPGPFATSDGIVVGTPPYMPPEQAMAQPLDERADVYALGAMLYHVLSGRRPYHNTRPREILSKVVEGPPLPLEDLTVDVAPDLLAIVNKAMARNPDDRYRTAEEMAEELRRFKAGRLVRAHDYSPLQLLTRFVRRNWAIVTTCAVALAVMVGFGTLSVMKIREQRDVAEIEKQQAEERLQKFILEKARVMLVSDPTETIAWLKHLPAGEPQAATAAAEAADLGVARWVLEEHTAAVNRVVVSPDGRLGASVADDSVAVLWDLETGAVVRRLTDHTEKITQVVFGPRGRWLATGSHDDTVRLWPIEGAGPARVFSGHQQHIKALTFDATGELVAAACEDGLVLVWSLDGTEQFRFDMKTKGRFPRVAFVPPTDASGRWLAVSGYESRVRLLSLDGRGERALAAETEQVGGQNTAGLAVSSDGRWLAAGTINGPMRLWDLQTGDMRTLDGEPDRWSRVAFSPEGDRLVAGGLASFVRVWSTSETKPVVRLHGHRERITDLRFFADGRHLLSASWDGTVRIWTQFEPEATADETLRGHADWVTSVAVTPNGSRILSGSADGTVRVWEVSLPNQHRLVGHSVGVHGLAFVGPDGQKLVSGGHDNTVRVWDLKTRRSTALEGHTDHIFRVQVSPDGRWAASSSDDQLVYLWDLDSLTGRPLSGHRADVEELTFSPDGRWLVSAGEDDVAYVWSIPDGKGQRLEGHTGDVTDVAFHPSKPWVATSSRDGTVRIWDVDGRVLQLFDAFDKQVWSVDFDPAGDTVAAASSDGTLRLISSANGQEIHRYDGLGEARRARYSPDGTFIAVTTSGKNLYLCRVAFDLCDRLYGPRATVQDLAFSRNSSALVVGGSDNTVRVYDVETQESRVYRGHKAPIFDVDVSPNGRWIASASADADVRLWELRMPPKPDQLENWLKERTRKTVELMRTAE